MLTWVILIFVVGYLAIALEHQLHINAAMGLEKIDFFWYMKKITPLAFAGYLAGILVYFLQQAIF